MSKTAIFWGIAIPILGIATYGLYRLYKKRNNTRPVTKTESSIKATEVSNLSMADVVQYFRSKELDAKKDKPFISTDFMKFGAMFALPMTTENKKLIFLGIYDGDKDEVSDIELIVANSLGDDVLSILGDDKMVFLS